MLTHNRLLLSEDLWETEILSEYVGGCNSRDGFCVVENDNVFASGKMIFNLVSVLFIVTHRSLFCGIGGGNFCRKMELKIASG